MKFAKVVGTCRECGRPAFKGRSSDERCSLSHCVWCECGNLKGRRICCVRCAELDGQSLRAWSPVTFELVQTLRAADNYMTTAEIARQVGRPREVVRRSLHVLRKRGMVLGRQIEDGCAQMYWRTA